MAQIPNPEISEWLQESKVQMVDKFANVGRIMQISNEPFVEYSTSIEIPTPYPSARPYTYTYRFDSKEGQMGPLSLGIDLPAVNIDNTGAYFFGTHGAIGFINGISYDMEEQTSAIRFTADDIYTFILGMMNSSDTNRLSQCGVDQMYNQSKLLDNNNQFLIPLPSPWAPQSDMFAMGADSYIRMKYCSEIVVQISFSIISNVIYNGTDDPIAPETFNPTFTLNHTWYKFNISDEIIRKNPLSTSFAYERCVQVTPQPVGVNEETELSISVGQKFNRKGRMNFIQLRGKSDIAGKLGKVHELYPIDYASVTIGGTTGVMVFSSENMLKYIPRREVALFNWWEDRLYMIPYCVTSDLDVENAGNMDFKKYSNLELVVRFTNRSAIDQQFEVSVLNICEGHIEYFVDTHRLNYI